MTDRTTRVTFQVKKKTHGNKGEGSHIWGLR